MTPVVFRGASAWNPQETAPARHGVLDQGLPS
jgi:hypothetical protein